MGDKIREPKSGSINIEESVIDLLDTMRGRLELRSQVYSF